MAIGEWRAFARDKRGKGAIKFALGTCLFAVAVASASPAFEANPLIHDTVAEMREHLPQTLEKARRALGGA